jgi:hypothetical protein
MDQNEFVDLPQTAAAWRAGKDESDIEDTLLDELQEHVSTLMEHADDLSSWTDDEEVEVVKLQITDTILKVKVAISFVEVIPSGCSDMPHHKDGRLELELEMGREDDSAIIVHGLREEVDQPDLWDLNSAADGT